MFECALQALQTTELLYWWQIQISSPAGIMMAAFLIII